METDGVGSKSMQSRVWIRAASIIGPVQMAKNKGMQILLLWCDLSPQAWDELEGIFSFSILKLLERAEVPQ